MSNNTADFSITVTGESTGTTWAGNFTVKIRLSHSDELRRDRIRKELLGPNPGDSTPRAKEQAEVFSQLAVRVVKAPEWWAATQGGLALEDDSVVASVFEEALKAERKALEDIQKKAKEAKESLSNG